MNWTFTRYIMTDWTERRGVYAETIVADTGSERSRILLSQEQIYASFLVEGGRVKPKDNR